MPSWTLYIVKCEDGSLYTGITTDIKERLKRHIKGHGSKYTREKKPVSLLFSQRFDNESSARIREVEIKKMSRSNKMKLIAKV